MAESDRTLLPMGWECKYDARTGRPYFINHFNRTTSWEDPRKFWQYAQFVQQHANPTEVIPLQTSGGSITGGNIVYAATHRTPQIYPTPSPYNNPQLAFLPPKSMQDLKTPMSTRSISGTTNRFGEMTIGSPTPVNNVETTLTQYDDIEYQVNKISSIFPTVSDTHIRLLLKKYHNRAALVVSALQVEKNPLCALGPCTPVGVHSNYAVPRWRQAIHAAITLNPPRGGRPAPHSPKMKLRYLKNIFPKVDETLLLDILEQSDNNVQKATDKLLEQGYEKRNPTGPSKLVIKPKDDASNETKIPPASPKIKTSEEKNKMKAKLMDKYKSVPDKVIVLALESVDYDEDRAVHILDIMIAEEAIQPLRTSSSHSSRSDDRKESPPITEPLKLISSPIKKVSKGAADEKVKRSKNKNETPKVSRGTSTADDDEYKSSNLLKPNGPNSELAKGPNSDLLLPDYAPWAGPDPSLLIHDSNVKLLTSGKDNKYISNRRLLASGPNSELRKGPLRGLAQGSIYSQRNAANTECRGK